MKLYWEQATCGTACLLLSDAMFTNQWAQICAVFQTSVLVNPITIGDGQLAWSGHGDRIIRVGGVRR